MVMRIPLVPLFGSRSFRNFWADLLRSFLVKNLSNFFGRFFKKFSGRFFYFLSQHFFELDQSFFFNFLGRRSKTFRTCWIENYSSLLVRNFISDLLGQNLFDLCDSKTLWTFWVGSFSNFLDWKCFGLHSPNFLRIFWFQNFSKFLDPILFELPDT